MITWSAHISMLFSEHDFLDRPRAASEYGFEAVEMWWPPEEAVDDLSDRLGALAVTCINAPSGDYAAGELGYLNQPGRHDEALEQFARAADLALAIGAPRVNLLVGREDPSLSSAQQRSAVLDVVKECAEEAHRRGLTVLIEPINDRDMPGYLVSTPMDAVALIERVGISSLKLLYDAYHTAMMGLGGGVLRDVFTHVDHVQYADAAGRGGPGTGTNDLRRLVEALLDLGYSGSIGLEYQPEGSTVESFDYFKSPVDGAPFPTPR